MTAPTSSGMIFLLTKHVLRALPLSFSARCSLSDDVRGVAVVFHSTRPIFFGARRLFACPPAGRFVRLFVLKCPKQPKYLLKKTRFLGKNIGRMGPTAPYKFLAPFCSSLPRLSNCGSAGRVLSDFLKYEPLKLPPARPFYDQIAQFDWESDFLKKGLFRIFKRILRNFSSIHVHFELNRPTHCVGRPVGSRPRESRT